MLRLVTYTTPSHEKMLSDFVLTRADGFDIHVSRYEQTCPTGSFKQEGWNDCMMDKLQTLLDVPADGDPVVYVDADVCLFPGFADWCERIFATLPPWVLLMSDDVVQWCAGVMLYRSTERHRRFFQLVADLQNAWNIPDQEVIHNLRSQIEQTKGKWPIDIQVIPPSIVSNWATVSRPLVPAPWQPGQFFEVPPTCLAWHANWTVGIENKMHMLRTVAGGRQHVSC